MRPYGGQEKGVARGDMVVREAGYELRMKFFESGHVGGEGVFLTAFAVWPQVFLRRCAEIGKKPGFGQGGTSDHDGGDAGLRHGAGGSGVGDGAVSGDGNTREVHEVGQKVKMNGAAVHLRGEARVQRESGASRVLRGGEKFRHENLVRPGAGPCFERDGEMCVLTEGDEAIVDVLRVFEQGGTGAFRPNFRHGASGVEVESDKTAAGGGFACRQGEFIGFGTEDLAHDRTFSR